MSYPANYNPFKENHSKGAFMKHSFLLLILLLSFSVSAKDMSRTENADEVYKVQEDGSVKYIGACSVHQDMAGVNFLVNETLVDYIDLTDSELTREEFLKQTSQLDIELINAAEKRASVEFPEGLDDFSADKIESTKFKGLDLYRLNIGVGGGNGMYLIYNRAVSKGKVSYKLMAKVFDGDVNYCDSKVWLTK